MHLAYASITLILVFALYKAWDATKKGYDAYVFGLPIVMNYAVLTSYVLNKKSGQYKAPFNVIHNEQHVFTYKDTSVITPNSDTPYSMLWLDLRNEPIVISVPEVKDRYYSVQMIDANTYNYGYIGTRSTGTDDGSYMVRFGTPKKSELLPRGVRKVYYSNTPFSLLIFRTQLEGDSDMKNVIRIQNKYRAQPLSEFLGGKNTYRPPIMMPQFTNKDIKTDFMGCLDKSLAYIPEDVYSKDVFEMLGGLGVGPKKTSLYSSNSPWTKFFVQKGLEWGAREVEATLKKSPKRNGWSFLSAYGNVNDYAGDWMKRAMVAKGGIYANDASEATYPLTYTDAYEKKLDGNIPYVIKMPLDNLPPAKGFWSITMYSARTQLLIKNPINRYLVNSEMVKSAKTDGKTLKIFVQSEPPKESDGLWLPSPKENFYLVMRIYYPSEKVSTWIPPSICPRVV